MERSQAMSSQVGPGAATVKQCACPGCSCGAGAGCRPARFTRPMPAAGGNCGAALPVADAAGGASTVSTRAS